MPKHTDEEILAAVTELTKDGTEITGGALRRVLKGGDPYRLKGRADELIAARGAPTKRAADHDEIAVPATDAEALADVALASARSALIAVLEPRLTASATSAEKWIAAAEADARAARAETHKTKAEAGSMIEEADEAKAAAEAALAIAKATIAKQTAEIEALRGIYEALGKKPPKPKAATRPRRSRSAKDAQTTSDAPLAEGATS